MALRAQQADFGQPEEDQDILSNEKVLARRIPWGSLHSATLINDDQLRLLKDYDKQTEEVRNALLQEKGQEYASTFLTLLSNLSKDETQQYVLTLVDELLTEDVSRADLFVGRKDEWFTLLFRMLNRTDSDPFTVAKASSIVAALLVRLKEVPTQQAEQFVEWLSLQLKSGNPTQLSTSLTALQTLLKVDQYRVFFYRKDGLATLGGLVRSQSNSFQLVYKCIYGLWLLSYYRDIADRFHETNAITHIVNCIRTSPKEKVVRIGLATLRNLQENTKNITVMVESGFMKVLENLGNRKWGDEDITADIEALREAVSKNMTETSSFDMYKQELLSGNLEWSPVHRSERFWRENVMKFEDNNFKALGVLVELLKTSTSSLVLSVVCYDVGEFVRFHPHGRNVINNFGVKEHVMKLMTHQDPDVQKHALLCIQKLMVHNWEYLTK